MFDLVDDLNNVVWFLIEDFFRLSPWSEGLSQPILNPVHRM